MIGTLLFSGTDIASVATVEDLSDFWSSAELRGDSPTHAGVPGATPIRRPAAGQVRAGQLVVKGVDAKTTTAAVAAARAVLRHGIPQTVTRRKVLDAGNLDTAQTAVTTAIAERWLGEHGCRLLISVETLDGPWYGASETIAAVGGVTIKGDSPTAAIVVTIAAGAVDPVLTNSANDFSFRYVGTVPSGGVEVDVANRRATGVTGSVDLSANLRWSKGDLLVFDPGAQTLAISDGSASFTYLPAYQ